MNTRLCFTYLDETSLDSSVSVVLSAVYNKTGNARIKTVTLRQVLVTLIAVEKQ